jgi:hypothetical protein
MYSVRRDELPSVKARMRATAAHPVRKREREKRERENRERRKTCWFRFPPVTSIRLV